MSKGYTWVAEERKIDALRLVLKTGEEFDAPDAIGSNLVEQGAATRNEAPKPSRKRTSAPDPED